MAIERKVTPLRKKSEHKVTPLKINAKHRNKGKHILIRDMKKSPKFYSNYELPPQYQWDFFNCSTGSLLLPRLSP